MKSKQFIRLFAFGSVCVFIIILLLTVGLSVSAEGNDSDTTVDKYGVTEAINNDDLDSDSPFYNQLYSSDNSAYNTFNDMIVNKTIPSLTFYPSARNENWLNYLFYANTNIGAFTSTPDTSFILTNGSNCSLMTLASTWAEQGGNYWADTHYSIQLDGTVRETNTNIARNTTYSIDGSSYIIQLSFSGQFLSTDLPIYYYEGDFPTTLEGLEQLDYNSGGGAGDSSNFLYFENADVTYDIGNLNGGNVSLWGTPNSYILSNSSIFTVKYKYTFAIDVAYNKIGGSHLKNDAVGSELYSVPMSDFVSNGYAVVNSLSTIESSATFTDGGDFSSIRSAVEYYYDQNVSNEWDPSKVKWYKFTLTTTFWVEDNRGNHSAWYQETYNFLDGNSTVNTDGITTNSNPVSNGSYNNDLTNDDVMNNDLTNGEGTSNDNIPSSNSGGSSNSYSSVGNITITNNNNVNANGSGSDSWGGLSSEESSASIGFWNTFNPFKLIFNKLTGDVNDISEDVGDELSANGFITVMGTTFGWIPTQVWTVLTWFLVATLSILIITFIVRIILDLL